MDTSSLTKSMEPGPTHILQRKTEHGSTILGCSDILRSSEEDLTTLGSVQRDIQYDATKESGKKRL